MSESTVLVHSYSFAAPITRNDSHEDNTNYALSQSISFGKFVTENLEWGKWSSFSHKKYVEEAAKYSRPGSVAQKKAFFEAHYKRIAEAKKAATEQEPTVTPAQVLLHTLETLPPPPIIPPMLMLNNKQQQLEGNEENEDELDENDELIVSDVVDVKKEEEKEKQEEDCSSVVVDEKVVKPRRSLTKNKPVFRLSLEKTIPPTATQIALSEKIISERPITQNNKDNHRQKSSFFNCFRGGAKTQDQIQSSKKKNKKEKKSFLCFCLNPKSVME